MVALVNEVIKNREHETVAEHSPVAESQSNGIAERATQAVQGMCRTLKLGLEKRIGHQISTAHPVMKWLVQHSGDLLTIYQVSRDGKTAYERLLGKRYKGEMIEFGARVLHRIPGWTKPGSEVGKFAARWDHGIWLGKRWGSGEHVIGTPDGIVRSRGIRKLPREDAWDWEALHAVKGTPWDPTGDEDNEGRAI